MSASIDFYVGVSGSKTLMFGYGAQVDFLQLIQSFKFDGKANGLLDFITRFIGGFLQIKADVHLLVTIKDDRFG